MAFQIDLALLSYGRRCCIHWVYFFFYAAILFEKSVPRFSLVSTFGSQSLHWTALFPCFPYLSKRWPLILFIFIFLYSEIKLKIFDIISKNHQRHQLTQAQKNYFPFDFFLHPPVQQSLTLQWIAKGLRPYPWQSLLLIPNSWTSQGPTYKETVFINPNENFFLNLN